MRLAPLEESSRKNGDVKEDWGVWEESNRDKREGERKKAKEGEGGEKKRNGVSLFVEEMYCNHLTFGNSPLVKFK